MGSLIGDAGGGRRLPGRGGPAARRIEELSGELARAEEQATRLAIARRKSRGYWRGRPPRDRSSSLMIRSPFSQSLFSALTAELGGPAAAGMTAFDLEQLVDGRGRELLL